MFTTNASRACVFRQGALLRSTARCASRCISFLPKPIAHAAPKSCSASSLLLGGATALAVGLSTASTLLADEKKEEMCYRMLGNTGLQVSVLGFGFFANYGTKKDLMDQAGIDMAKASLRLARDAGVNLFDNAETYGNPQGAAEIVMGEAIRQLREEEPEKWRRSDIILTTKIFWGGPGVNEKGLSMKHCREGMASALQRLQVDYVDLVFCHRPDPLTPTATVVRAMSDLVSSGKATAWGTSEWSAQQITEAFYIAKMEGLHPPQFEQPQYNMFIRERFEKEYYPLCQEPYKIGTTIWGALAMGFLTGKYNDGIPANSRADHYAFMKERVEQWRAEGKIDKVKAISSLAQSKGCTTGQLAMAWCLKNPHVSTLLIGGSSNQQVAEALGALAVAKKLTKDDMDAIEKILKNKPENYVGYGGPLTGFPRDIHTL